MEDHCCLSVSDSVINTMVPVLFGCPPSAVVKHLIGAEPGHSHMTKQSLDILDSAMHSDNLSCALFAALIVS